MEKVVKIKNIFAKAYKGKKVLITGHTGFKGSWLSLWLKELDADVAGFSLYLPSEPSHFELLGLQNKIKHYKGDIREKKSLSKVFDEFKPEIVFHLAAQSIVRKSYEEPKLTFDTNFGGTVNVLDCIKEHKCVTAAVIITSDKCYENVSWEFGYRENDLLGGEDPYSASKACAEIATQAYIRSYFSFKDSPNIATARAGNVIGGGDWAQDRIVPDCVKSWGDGKEVNLRNPNSTRPWQHVLEPLGGYLLLGASLLKKSSLTKGEAFNFGPQSVKGESVKDLVKALEKYWKGSKCKHVLTDKYNKNKKEAVLLKLCCDKAYVKFKWSSVLDFHETARLTAEWYNNYYNNKEDIYNFSCSQIKFYIKKGIENNIDWILENKI